MSTMNNVKNYLNSLTSRTATTNNTARNVGIALVAAGALAYPAYRLYKYIKNKRANSQADTTEPNAEQKQKKSFAPNYLGDHRPHHAEGREVSHA